MRKKFEAVVLSEVLLHIPPSDVGDAVRLGASLTQGCFFMIDLAFRAGTVVHSHNFMYDVIRMFSDAGFDLLIAKQLAGRKNVLFYGFKWNGK